MIVSHAERWRRGSLSLLSALALATLAAFPPAAQAQEPGDSRDRFPPRLIGPDEESAPVPPYGGPAQLPRRLAPPRMLRPAKQGKSLAPAPEQGDRGDTPTVIVDPVMERVEMDTLSAIDVDSSGILGPEQGGLGVAMWTGTPRAIVDSLLPRLPVGTTSVAARSLMRRLLLSTATAPKGEAPKGSLLAMRARLLVAMGDLPGVEGLLGVVPVHEIHPDIARVRIDAWLLANDNARACELAATQIANVKAPYWHKAFIFCQSLAGEHDQAALGASLLVELGENDPAFFTLVDALAAGGPAELDSLPEPTPLHLAMARASSTPLPANALASNQPALLRTIAVTPKVSKDARLEAAERATSMGVLGIDLLRQIYEAVDFSQDELANPFSGAENRSGPASRALLYRAAKAQSLPVAQAEAVAKALKLGQDGGRFLAAARAFAPVVAEITPSTELAWFAPQAIRALLAAGRYESISPWFNLLRAKSMFDRETEATMSNILPLAYIAQTEEAAGWTPERLHRWWQRIKDGDGARDRAAILYSVLGALGEELPPSLWEPLVPGTEKSTVAMPHPAIWHRMADAARQGRVGEAVLLSLIVLGNGGPEHADAVVLAHVLQTLMAAGLGEDTRALALEAVLAGGT